MMEYCFICTFRGRMRHATNRMVAHCPQCGVEYSQELYHHLQDLIQRGAPHMVIWDEVFSIPQPQYNGRAQDLDPRRAEMRSREERDWVERESTRRLYNEMMSRANNAAHYYQVISQQQAQAYQQQMLQAMGGFGALAYGGVTLTGFQPQQCARECTPEERAQLERLCAAERAAQEKREEDSKTARQRSRVLLIEHIGEDAVSKMELGGTYPIPSKRYKGTEYHLRLQKKPVRVVNDGDITHEICIQPTDSQMPDYDVVLALKKLIEHDETILIGTGNIVGGSSVVERITRTLGLNR